MRLLSTARRAAAVLLSAAVLAVVVPSAAHAAGTEVYDGDFPDPFVLPATSPAGTTTYWAYATGTGGLNLQVIRSRALLTWSRPTDPLPVLPTWAQEGHTWAPSVVAVGRKHVLYYTARHAASGRQCIGRAVSTTGPAGPFADASSRPLVCQLEFHGSIDPDVFRDGDGELYLHWKSDDNAEGGVPKLFGQPLTTDGLRFVSGSPRVELLRYEGGWEAPLIEGPQMVRTPAGRLHLFHGANWWESPDAGIGFGTCTGPLGRCTKVTTRGPWLRADRQRVGPAGPTFFPVPGGHLVAYHAWDDAVGYARGGRRSLWVQAVTFDAAGVPVLGR